MHLKYIYFNLIILNCFIYSSFASVGDNLLIFRKCLTFCLSNNCSNSNKIKLFKERQPFYLKILKWNCDEECKYQCQWSAIDYLIKEIGSAINLPQFYGKWTFYRIWGVQEPASALFSLFNLISTYLAWNKYCRPILSLGSKLKNEKKNIVFKTIDRHFISSTIHAVLSMNAWLWSTIFHIHDTSLTEKLDYFSAFSVTLFSFYLATLTLFDDKLNLTHENLNLFCISLFAPFFGYYLYHIYYLSYIHFDYGYNMRANLVAGFTGSFLWLIFCYRRLPNLSFQALKSSHIKKCVACIIIINSFLLFELNDFAPIYFLLDAHSLWHFGTIFVPFIWFSFLKEEAFFSQNIKK